jgi:uncharacterized protein (TIGR03437 family)
LFFCPAQAVVDVSKCTAAELSYAGPTQINFRIPNDLTVAGTYGVVVRVNGLLDADAAIGNPRTAIVSGYAPTIFWMGYDCFTDTRFQDANKNCGLTATASTTYQATRGAVTDLAGRVLTSSNAAQFGQYYSIWMTGLGVFNNGKPSPPISMALTNIPTYAAGGRLFPGDGFPEVISPSYIGESGIYPGLYQINFQLLPPQNSDGPPNAFPCGQLNWEFSVSIAQGLGFANLVQIPILVKPGDLPCGG